MILVNVAIGSASAAKCASRDGILNRDKLSLNSARRILGPHNPILPPSRCRRPTRLDIRRRSPHIPVAMSIPATSDSVLEAALLEAADGGLPSARGAPRLPMVLEFSRNLVQSDIAAIFAGMSVGSAASPLKVLRQQHHALARLLADGVPQVEAAAITGYAQSRISVLKHDPAFQELIAHYTTVKREVYVDVHQRMAHLGLAAADELRDRLEDKPASFSNRELKDIMVDAVDRSGTVDSIKASAGAKGVSVTVNFVKSPHADAPKPRRPGEIIETVDFEMIEEPDGKP